MPLVSPCGFQLPSGVASSARPVWFPLPLGGVVLKNTIFIMGSTIHLKHVVPFSLASMFPREKPVIAQIFIPLQTTRCFVAVIFPSFSRYAASSLVSSFLIKMCLRSFKLILFGARLASPICRFFLQNWDLFDQNFKYFSAARSVSLPPRR